MRRANPAAGKAREERIAKKLIRVFFREEGSSCKEERTFKYWDYPKFADFLRNSRCL